VLTVFAGEDTFRSREAYLTARADAKTRGDIRVLRDDMLSVAELTQVLSGSPLFGGTPAVAVEGLTAFTGQSGERVAHLLESLPPARVVLAWESGVPDGRTLVWKALKKNAENVRMYDALPEAGTTQWVEERVCAGGGTILRPAVTALLHTCGTDLWTLAAEIEKLLLAAGGRAIAPGDVAEFCVGRSEVNVFATVRALAAGDGRASLRALSAHRARGDDGRLILSLLVREVRNLLVIRDLLDRRRALTPSAVSSLLRVPGFVGEMLLQTARRLASPHLRTLFDRLVVSLYALNTGRAEPDDVLDSLALHHSAPH
jgi:DNA polymerase III subunit delta